MKKKMLCLGMMMLLVFVVMSAQNWIIENESTEAADFTKQDPLPERMLPKQEDLQFYGLDYFSTSLPVLFMDTGEKRITKENKIWAKLAILHAPAAGKERSILEMPEEKESILINYRGASSYAMFDKKQYRIKFYQKEGSQEAKDCAFLGMGAHSEWVLNGPFLDKSLLRNRLAYELAGEVFAWAPDCRYTEVFVDGKYQGVYLAVEPITNGESRLGLCKFGLLSGQTAYIIKRDRVDSEELALPVYGKYTGKTSNDLYIDYPTKKRITKQQRDWICEDITKFERSLYGENFKEEKQGYRFYIDVDAFADYYVFNEIFMNHDAGNLSTYFYKDINGKLTPCVWDYNNCLDNYQWFAQDYTEFFVADSAWFSRLLQDKDFVEKVVQRYYELRKSVFSNEHVEELLEDYQEELGDAIDRNFAVWGYTFQKQYLSDENNEHRNAKSYAEAVELLQNAFRKRVEFLDQHISDLYTRCEREWD